ncbi:MAG: hypothetical protein WC819_05310 [Parcubacteria group bacterium]|jgi:hypothetical protein
MQSKFTSAIPKVGQIVEITVKDFVMEARVKYRYANPVSQEIVLDVTDAPKSTIPVVLVYQDGNWKVTSPERCPFYNREVFVNVLE